MISENFISTSKLYHYTTFDNVQYTRYLYWDGTATTYGDWKKIVTEDDLKSIKVDSTELMDDAKLTGTPTAPTAPTTTPPETTQPEATLPP
mgnify:CR=1 FL=1